MIRHPAECGVQNMTRDNRNIFLQPWLSTHLEKLAVFLDTNEKEFFEDYFPKTPEQLFNQKLIEYFVDTIKKLEKEIEQLKEWDGKKEHRINTEDGRKVVGGGN